MRKQSFAPMGFHLRQQGYAWSEAGGLETHGKLRGEQVIVLPLAAGFLLKAVLNFHLRVGRKTIDGGEVDPRQILRPLDMAVARVDNIATELLFPEARHKQ